MLLTGVRLIGIHEGQGRVEVYTNGNWGTVCTNAWDDNDATVICHQLGMGDFGFAISGSTVPHSNASSLMDNVHCYGSETDIFDCQHDSSDLEYCKYTQKAGVKCSRMLLILI